MLPLFHRTHYATPRTHDADGHDFTIDERRSSPRYSPRHLQLSGTDEEILDRIYKTIEAAQLSKRIGHHYKCAYNLAAILLEGFLSRGYRNPKARKGRVPIDHIFRAK